MIRFRVGHSWKREASGPGGPRDAFTFELDGVNLLPGANDEPLIRIVQGLVDAVASLVVDGERAGQLSLEDVHLEVCLWRTAGTDVEVSIVDLGQPPRRLRPPVTVELSALVDAAVQCARTFVRELGEQRAANEAELVALERRLKTLTGSLLAELAPRDEEPWSAVRPADGGNAPGVGYVLRDDTGRTLAWSRKTRAGLPPLLIDGSITLLDGAAVTGLPFLTMQGLARAATEGHAELAGHALAPETVFAAGLDLCLALRAHNPALGTNPYVESLQVRCTDGLTALRRPVPDTSAAKVSAPRPSVGPPISATGQVRRVALTPSWSRPVALGEEGARLLLGRGGVIVHSAHAAHAFSAKGVARFRRLAPRGVAVAASGASLVATPERVLFFSGPHESARWLRDHDGVQLGPTLAEIDGVLVTPLARRGVAGFDAMTGRERWRFDPPRTQRAHLSVIGHRVLVGTDGGSLYGLDAADGQARFRVSASLPCVAPAIAAGHRAIAALNRGEHSAVFLCDALSKGSASPAGAIAWTRELMLSNPCSPVTARGRTWIGGVRDGRTSVVCLGPRGQVLWERTVPCDGRTLALLPLEGGVVASDARGMCVRLLPDGQPAWVLGSEGDELGRAIAPQLSRHVLVIAGPVLRVVQPSGGRVLAELDVGARTADVVVDKKLTIYVFKEPGTLEAWSPATVLSVV